MFGNLCKLDVRKANFMVKITGLWCSSNRNMLKLDAFLEAFVLILSISVDFWCNFRKIKRNYVIFKRKQIMRLVGSYN